ncbi:MAG: LysM peptidoglycan-binding domain-containing protein [Rikenellaceae bacterium]|nr:LysM peptidoglycan-binding domain-containing protein [Rikenellaceae bacterium]
MRILRLLLVALCATIAMEAYGIEPSTQIVVRDGRKVYVHKVEKGHTLYSIAKAYGVTEKQIIDCNEGLSPATLRIDDIIFVPCVEKKGGSKQKTQGDGKDGGKYYIHTVQSGDTFYSIARHYKISVDVLRADNPSVDPSTLSIGTELRIRRGEVGYATTDDIDKSEKREQGEEPKQELRSNEYVVQKGDTVYSLSQRAGLSEREFMALNKLRSPSDLKLGMVVKLRSDIEEGIAQPGSEDVSAQDAEMEQSEAIEEAEMGNQSADAEETIAPQKQRERLSGRSDSNPIVDNRPKLPWFLFGLDDDEVDLFRPNNVQFIELGANSTLKVALMLPFQIDGKAKPLYVDLYRGVLLAMEDLKAEGLSVDLTVFDTQNDAAIIDDIMTYEDAFLDAHLIIGPVYEKEMQYIINHAEREGVAVVSPLANIESLQSPVLFQMQPERTHKYDKIKHLLNDDREVIVIYASTNDGGYLSDMNGIITSSRRRDLVFNYNQGAFFYKRTASGGRGESVSIDDIVRSRHDKTFVIVADGATDIDRILTTLSSSKTKLLDRGAAIGRYDVVGNYKWTRLNNVDPQSFFKNNVSFISSYHLKRSNEVIRIFDARYIKRFGSLPSAYSYRGYDAALIFCSRMFLGFEDNIFSQQFKPLTTTYRFMPEGGINVNTEWICESYNDDFTITVK